jgi:hypothetical protein
MPKTEHFGHAGLAGWRETVANRVAPHAATRTPASEEQVRAIVGATFFLLSLYYVVTSIGRMVKAVRD